MYLAGFSAALSQSRSASRVSALGLPVKHACKASPAKTSTNRIPATPKTMAVMLVPPFQQRILPL